jgi:hypothetical protein
MTFDIMYRKPSPSDKDVEALAARFRDLWTPDQTVRPYLRKHGQFFREQLEDGWSWAGLALALTKAGITYQTGTPWSADALIQAFSRAQSPLRGHGRRTGTGMQPHAAIPDGEPEPRVVHVSSERANSGGTAKPAPRFKAVSIRPSEPRRPKTEEELAEIERNRILTFGRS